MNISKISATEFLSLNESGALQIIDVRTPAENAAEGLDNATLLPLHDLCSEKIQGLTEQGRPVYLLCQSGKRADIACSKVGDCERELCVIEGGMNAMKQAGFKPVARVKNAVSLERQVRICAGALVLLGCALGFTASSYFFGLSAFVGAGLVFAGLTDTCAMGMLLARMPWNRL